MTRSIADQSEAEPGGRVSVLSRQRADHVRLDRLLEELQGATGAAQDAVLWPVVRRHLPDGGPLTLEVEQEHQEVNELVTRLERIGHDDPVRPAVVRRLVQVLREDVRDEEDVLLPRLQTVIDAAHLRRLGVLWEVVRRVAPTRGACGRRPPSARQRPRRRPAVGRGPAPGRRRPRRSPGTGTRDAGPADRRRGARVGGPPDRADAVPLPG